MEHVYLFYLFITLLTGIVSLGIVTFIYVKTRETVVEYYLGFYLAFTLVIVPNVLLTYVEINMPLSNFVIAYAFRYFFSEIAVFALMFTIPVFIHYLCATHQARKKNIFFGGLAIVLAIAHQVFEYLDEEKSYDNKRKFSTGYRMYDSVESVKRRCSTGISGFLAETGVNYE